MAREDTPKPGAASELGEARIMGEAVTPGPVERAGSIPGWRVPGYHPPKSAQRDRAHFLEAIRKHAPEVESDFLALRPLAEAAVKAQIGGYAAKLNAKARDLRAAANGSEPSVGTWLAEDPDNAERWRRFATSMAQEAEGLEFHATRVLATLDSFHEGLPAGRRFPFDAVLLFREFIGVTWKVGGDGYHPTARGLMTADRWADVLAYREALVGWASKYHLAVDWILDLGEHGLGWGDPEPFRLPELNSALTIGRLDGLPEMLRLPAVRAYDFSESEADYVERVVADARALARTHVRARVRQAQQREGTRTTTRWHRQHEQHLVWAARWQVSKLKWGEFTIQNSELQAVEDHRNLARALRKVLEDLGLEPREGLSWTNESGEKLP